MQVSIIYCENCDKVRYPEELCKWEGKCDSCKRDTARIVVFDIPESEKLIPA